MNISTAEIKNYLHKLIVETDDETILIKVQAYFTTLKSNKDVEWWDMISDPEKEAIEIGLKQLERGKGIPHHEVKCKVNKLLGKE